MCTYSGRADNCYQLIQRQWVRVRVSGDLLVREPCRHRTADLSKPPHCRAVGLVSLLRKECCQPFVKSSGCLAHSTTCCKYQWSERGPFDFSDTLFIGVMLLLLVSTVAGCQLVGPVGWGAWVEDPYIKNARSSQPPQKPLALMSNLASSPQILFLIDNTSPVRGCRGGSTVMSLHTYFSRSAVISHSSLWQMNGYPPVLVGHCGAG